MPLFKHILNRHYSNPDYAATTLGRALVEAALRVRFQVILTPGTKTSVYVSSLGAL